MNIEKRKRKIKGNHERDIFNYLYSKMRGEGKSEEPRHGIFVAVDEKKMALASCCVLRWCMRGVVSAPADIRYLQFRLLGKPKMLYLTKGNRKAESYSRKLLHMLWLQSCHGRKTWTFITGHSHNVPA